MVLFNPLNWKLMQCNGSSVFMCCTELLQSCPALCDPIDCSLPGSSVHGILQAKILEWVAVPFSRGSSAPRDEIGVSYISCVGCWVFFTIRTTWEAHRVHNCSLFKLEGFSFLIHKVFLPQADQEIRNTCVQLFVTPWMVAPQVPRSMELSRQEYWIG